MQRDPTLPFQPDITRLDDATHLYMMGIYAALTRRHRDGKPLGVEKVDAYQARMLGEAAKSYLASFMQDTRLNLWEAPAPTWCTIDPDEWRAKTDLEKHELIETSHAQTLYEAWHLMPKAIPAGENCLDIGSGSGFFLKKMQADDKEHTWHGIDLPLKLVSDGTTLDRKNIPNFQEYDGRKLPYPDGFFGAITLHKVFHHVSDKDLDNLKQEIIRVLKPGGQLRITEEYAGVRLDHNSRGNWLPNDSAALLPRLLDQIFYPGHASHQRDVHHWRQIFKDTNAFEEKPTVKAYAAYNSLGLPMGEIAFAYTKKMTA